MPERELNLLIVSRMSADGAHLAEALFFPELSRLGDEPGGLDFMLAAQARRLLADLPAGEFHRRRVAGEPAVRAVEVTVTPPHRSIFWKEPVRLRFQYVCWDHGEHARIAYVPSLGIEVLAEPAEDLERRVAEHIRFALARRKDTVSLKRLVPYGGACELTLAPRVLLARIPTPKQAAREKETQEPQKSVLEEVGLDLRAAPLEPAYEIDAVVERLADALTGEEPLSALLIGPSGVGKTAAVHELVRQRQKRGLGQTPFWATSGARLIAGMTGFGMWQDRCRRLCQEAAKQRVILHLGNLIELLELGRHEMNSQSIGEFLQPHLARGEVLAVAECTPEQVAVVEQRAPQLLSVFQRIVVDPPDEPRTRAILRNFTRRCDDAALDMLYALHRRYAAYSTMPGRALRFLRNLLNNPPPDRAGAPTARDVLAAFARETGLPLFLLDENVPLDLDQARQWFTSRLMGQTEAIDLVVDLLAALKAGLTRPGRPIASLLFIGPTGVGKTEMAKCLAEHLFGDRQRLLRFDMSEYSDPLAVRRLVGLFGTEGQLTAKVRERPFSVILLDEFEKAHHSLYDLLLQVLGEGRLTDAGGRVADFSTAVVIMTSNLGAAELRGGRLGFRRAGDAIGDAREHFTEAVRDFLRPELYNRIDRIVPFAPLDEAALLRIARRELEIIGQRDGLRFAGGRLQVVEAAVRHMADKGWHPQYGARPLKRAIERELLVPLADELNTRAAPKESDAAEFDARVEFDGDRLAPRLAPRAGAAKTLVDFAWQASHVRRKLQELESCATMRDIRNEITRLRRRLYALLGARQLAAHSRDYWDKLAALDILQQIRAKLDPADVAFIERLQVLEQIAADADAQRAVAGELEEEVLLKTYQKEAADSARWKTQLDAAEAHCNSLILTVYGTRFVKPDAATLGVFGEDREWMLRLARAYFEVARGWNAAVRLHIYAPDPKTQALQRRPVAKPLDFFAAPPQPVYGVLFALEGKLVRPRLEDEAGRHVFEENKDKRWVCLVRVGGGRLDDFEPPPNLERQRKFDEGRLRRTYDLGGGRIKDERTGERPFSVPALPDKLKELLEWQLDGKLEEMLGER